MSGRRPSPRVAKFVRTERDPGGAEEARWPVKRLLLVLLGVPIVVVAAFFWAIATSCGCTPLPSLPASPVDGVVVSVDAASLGDVRGFSLRVSNGVVYEMKLGQLQNATQFSPSHLAEHQATSSPIRAWYLLDDGTPVVYRLEDAPS
jgi:hypothetical protein